MYILVSEFECQKHVYFKTQFQPGPVAKNATPRPPAGNWTQLIEPNQRSTDFVLYIFTGGGQKKVAIIENMVNVV